MDTGLLSERSIWTMVHGMVLGGGALLGLAAALFGLWVMRAPPAPDAVSRQQARQLAWLTGVIAVALWLTVLAGTYITFPPYRATPPAGLADLGHYPRSLLQSNPGTAWLHSFGMELKEHVPWIAAMLATAVAFVAARYRSRLLSEMPLRRPATMLLAICFVLVSLMAVLGVFINKVAPLE